MIPDGMRDPADLNFRSPQPVGGRCRRTPGEMLNNARRRIVAWQKLGHSFLLWIDKEGNRRYRYHLTDILIVHPDGSFTWNNGGFTTMGTRAKSDKAFEHAGLPVRSLGGAQGLHPPAGNKLVRRGQGLVVEPIPAEIEMRAMEVLVMLAGDTAQHVCATIRYDHGRVTVDTWGDRNGAVFSRQLHRVLKADLQDALGDSNATLKVDMKEPSAHERARFHRQALLREARRKVATTPHLACIAGFGHDGFALPRAA